MNQTDASDDFDVPDEDERQTVSRRLFTYSTKAIVTASGVDRIFVSHSDFKAALEGCDRVFQLGRELSVQQGLVLAGPTGAGKTALIRYFRRSVPPSTLFETGLGALAVRLPAKPNVGHLVSALLRQLRYPFPSVSAHTLSQKRDVLIEALRKKGTRLIFVDEAHHLRSQTKMRTRSVDSISVTDCLRELMDDVPLALVLSGSLDLLALVDIDDHLDNRVSARFQLKDFELGSRWLGLMKAFFKQSQAFDLAILNDKAEADRLHKATAGSLRQFKRLLTEAVLVAVDEHCAAVSAEHLSTAFMRVAGGMGRVGNPYA
jgi:type II secretory pathway predicted ATPase ExeA